MFTEAAKALLKRAGTKLIIADVGSAGGFHPRVAAVRDEAQLFGFDADPVECERLNKEARAGERHINAAIGREGEKVTVELHRKRQTSSIYPSLMGRLTHYPDEKRFETESTITFTTRSLDSICEEEGIPRMDFIKLDIEGHELATLHGCTKPLLMAEIEVTFHPFREGVPLFHEIMSYMTSRGFVLIDLRRTFWHPKSGAFIPGLSTKGFLFFGDALFVLDPFNEKNRQILSTADARARYFALLCMYGYAAEVLMIAQMFKDAGLMEGREFEETTAIVRNGCAAMKRMKLKGLGRLFRIAEKFIRLPVIIRSGLYAGEWAQADREVGNWP